MFTEETVSILRKIAEICVGGEAIYSSLQSPSTKSKPPPANGKDATNIGGADNRIFFLLKGLLTEDEWFAKHGA